LFYKGKGDRSWCVVVPWKISGKLIDTVHRQFGTYKTSKYIQGIYYWKGMSRDIRRRIRGCDICQRVKHNNINMEGKYKAIIPDQPNEIISIDFYGPLPQSIGGIQYLIVILDVFSKHIALYAIKKANTRTALKKLKEDYFIRIGKPKAILSDNGTQFTSRFTEGNVGSNVSPSFIFVCASSQVKPSKMSNA